MHNVTNKKLAIAPDIDLSKFGSNRTIEDHVRGLVYLANTSVDLIAVHEGRGYGNAPYYWPTEIDLPVKLIDPILDEILFLHHAKSWRVNGTFKEAYTGSVHELFAALGNASDYLRRKTNLAFELWLAVEAFENLKNDTCIPLPTIHRLPGVIVIDRASKSRIDQALTHGSAKVQGAVAFSWDPDFTCTTKTHRNSLAEEIKTDAGRPIIADCFLHSPENRSVVVLGYGLTGETQGFDLDWPDRDGHRHIVNKVYGYYYEVDYGIQHHLIGSMAYIQMFDAYNIIDLADKGYMKIKAEESYHECVLTFDYTT
ncbi:hypothetical protein FSP39_009155 [Pinctada imbricata]|uniref:Uncharacterized protein n=1 Tax=Pinctada imbricata TaxID=66713 RepID=A0AA88YDH0_PINIB|nr:hypothetical protein FSP39_009155 [Pinctada imbricata]